MAPFNYKSLGDLELQKARDGLLKNRQAFWKNNIGNFSKNIKYLTEKIGSPKGWKIYSLIGEFITNKEIRPYDYDAWSITVPSAATEKQGHEILMYFNRAKAYLSLAALLPLVVHEMAHTLQIAKNPEQYIRFSVDDKLCDTLEQEAESAVIKINKEFIKQHVLESIAYCYDQWGWEAAERMATYFLKEKANMYGGGYKSLMDEQEFTLFQEAKRINDIMAFIKRYIQR